MRRKSDWFGFYQQAEVSATLLPSSKGCTISQSMNNNFIHDSIPKCNKRNSVLQIAKCIWDIPTEKTFIRTKEEVLQQLRSSDAPHSLDLLQSWTSVVNQSLISLSLVYCIRKANDDDALFLLSCLCEDDSTAYMWEIMQPEKKEMNVNIRITTLSDGQHFRIKALLDCRYTDSSINRKFVAKHRIKTHKLLFSKPTSNADRTPNKNGATRLHYHAYGNRRSCRTDSSSCHWSQQIRHLYWSWLDTSS